MKTSELSGAALDWAVSKAEGMAGHYLANPYSYSTNWIFGGPIIEREKIELLWLGTDWRCWSQNDRVSFCLPYLFKAFIKETKPLVLKYMAVKKPKDNSPPRWLFKISTKVVWAALYALVGNNFSKKRI